ncbi:GNAT family N-acetyltransferase [Chryseomicrobium palamuruense]|uniref:GNAT family N-acetyltransferase n=1 Tax=Chryseomicrobium palamuruense TaxID=682973 RepID=A0ABV8UYV3_9BACL
MKITKYEPQYEEGWLRCRVLAYLHTSMYEDVKTSKPMFDGRPTIELLAIEDDMVVGILDMVLDTEEIQTSFLAKGLGAFLSVIAVHPDYQGRGIGQQLYDKALEELKQTPIEFIELYTRGDESANNFYRKLGFELLLETYDVFGVEHRLGKDVVIKGIQDKKLLVETEDGQPCTHTLDRLGCRRQPKAETRVL